MTFMKKILFAVLVGFSLILLASCRSEITLTAQEDGSVKIQFEGECGPSLEKMIRSFSDSDSTQLFDGPGIRESFSSNGFQSVSVQIPSNTGISSSFIAPSKTFLFESGLVICDKKNVIVNLSPEILKRFYDSSSGEILSFLDLLLAPVFNDEIMSEEEYIETLNSFYGSETGKEIGDCNIKLNLISVYGQKKEALLPLAKLLSLSENLVYLSVNKEK